MSDPEAQTLHAEAGEEFASLLKRSFPSLAERISDTTAISFRGTVKGRHLSVTIESLEKRGDEERKFSRHYNPTDPEVQERRRCLFRSIKEHHTTESAIALRRLTKMYSGSEVRD